MGAPKTKIRVLLSKSGLDYHDRGVRYVAIKLKEAGMEVIYTQYRIIEEVAKTAIEEDVDVIGISSSAGGYLADISRLKELLKQSDRESVPVIVGGVVADRDIPKLLDIGVGAVYGPGSKAEDAIKWINGRVTRSI